MNETLVNSNTIASTEQRGDPYFGVLILQLLTMFVSTFGTIIYCLFFMPR